MASHRKPRPGGTPGAGIGTPALATAALTSVAVLAQTAEAAPTPAAGHAAPSPEEVERKIDDLYRRAESAAEAAAAGKERAGRTDRGSGRGERGAERWAGGPEQGSGRGGGRGDRDEGAETSERRADSLQRLRDEVARRAQHRALPNLRGMIPAQRGGQARRGAGRAGDTAVTPAVGGTGLSPSVRATVIAPPVGETAVTGPAPDTGRARHARDTRVAPPVREGGIAHPLRDMGAGLPVPDTGIASPLRETGITSPVGDAEIAPVRDTGIAPPARDTAVGAAAVQEGGVSAAAQEAAATAAAVTTAPRVAPVAAPATSQLDAVASGPKAAKAAVQKKLAHARVLLVQQAVQAAAAPSGTYATKARKAIAFARAQVGKPCVWGAAGPGSYDCSGLTQAAWKSAGVTLPRTAREQAAAGTPVPPADTRPGDLVFFHDDVSHVGLCTGDGMMIHAPRPGAYVREEPVSGIGESAVHSVVRPG